MGTVYQAHDPLIDRMVAIKVVRTDALDQATRAAFSTASGWRCRPPGAAPIPPSSASMTTCEGAGDPSIVMELVEGSSLQAILRDAAARAGLQPRAGSCCRCWRDLATRTARASSIATSSRPTSSSPHPAQAKIADFGIARLNAAVLTHAGAMLGTPHYMAPEQVADEEVDRRADLFAVGAIFYEILAGRPPFAGRTMAETIQRLGGPDEADIANTVPDAAYRRDPAACIGKRSGAALPDRGRVRCGVAGSRRPRGRRRS